MWEDTIQFFSLNDPNVKSVVLGTLLLGISSSVIGCLNLFSKKTLVIDAISHSMLPGICLGFLWAGEKNPLTLLIGGMATAVLSVYLIGWISRNSKIKTDAAIAISLTLLFSLGVILLNVVQNTGNPKQSGLSDFLFGKAASMVRQDVLLFSIISLISLGVILIFYRFFKISLFDPIFAKNIGLPTFWIQSLVSFLSIIIAAVGIQTVGIVLLSAMMITPSSCALLWSKKFNKTLILSAVIGAFCAICGVYISYLLPKMPTGPWIVVCLALFFAFSFLTHKITQKTR